MIPAAIPRGANIHPAGKPGIENGRSVESAAIIPLIQPTFSNVSTSLRQTTGFRIMNISEVTNPGAPRSQQ